MCGIIGFIGPESMRMEAFIDSRGRLEHRSPDDSEVWKSADATVLLGHRRLSILDLSSTGHQPMLSECNCFVIVFNGEIYNYLELKAEFESLGHHFKGSGDTEVILAAYRQWSDDCLHRFNGMFALAIWDKGTPEIRLSIFLAQDRTGKKPLYYAHHGKSLAFASELKAIPVKLRGTIDFQALNFYLALGYIPAQHCIASGVKKLPPAYAARFLPHSGELKVWRWWKLPNHRGTNSNDIETLIDEADSLLRESVRLRMRSDAPVGVLLSGGLDSSLIVACAAQAVSQPVKTFTMGLPGSALDETEYANVVARHFGTDHHILEMSSPSLDILDEIAAFVDEPIADSSLIPTYMVSKLTAQHVKVALGGDGGDELFGGYNDYTTAFSDNARFGWLLGQAFRLGATLAGRLPTGMRGRNRLSALRGGPFQSLVWGSPYFDTIARRRIMSADVVASLGNNFDAPEAFLYSLFQEGQDSVDSITRTHFGSIMPDDFLVKVDRASMAVSLEMRAPFLDANLIEFAFGRLPSEYKVTGAGGRILQKRLAQRILPAELDINRKQGFSILLNEWIRDSDFSWLDDDQGRLTPMIDVGELKLKQGHMAGRANGSLLYALSMLGMAVKNIFNEPGFTF